MAGRGRKAGHGLRPPLRGPGGRGSRTCTARPRWSTRTDRSRCSMPAAAPAASPSSSARRGRDVVGVDVDPSHARGGTGQGARADLGGGRPDRSRRSSRAAVRRRGHGGQRPHLRPSGTEGPVLANVARLLVSGGPRSLPATPFVAEDFDCDRPRCPGPGRWSRARGPLVHLGPANRSDRTDTYAVSVHRKAELNGPPRNGGRALGDLTH